MATISTTYLGDMLFETQVGRHTIKIDVPAAMGGTDRAPTPPEFFVASLGSCIAAFVAQYCERSAIDAQDLRVDISYDKANDPTRLVNLKATVHIPNGDCGDRVGAIERVAAHCPVHATINTMEALQIEIISKEDLVGQV
ncbi:MAG TPA: OsmC family protein [Anaerolineales bacterium]|nr:OsmC family protein [Anaerolineales bacterium]HRF50215.1 OsmC family protein [Anaerolineales bacterium]